MSDAVGETQAARGTARPTARPRRLVSIRYSLARNLMLMIGVTSGAILVVSYVWSARIVSELSADLIDQRIDQTELELRRFFAPAQNGLLLFRDWGAAGLLEEIDRSALESARAQVAGGDTRSIEALNGRFIPLLTRMPQISSMMIADTQGEEYLLLRSEGRWWNRITQAEHWGSQTFWMQTESTGATGEHEWRELDYDPRSRPWFLQALAEDVSSEIQWTRPYKFFTTGDPGITASLSWTDPRQPAVRRVMAFDVLLTDVSNFTTSLRVSANGKVLVLTEDRVVAGLPRDERFDTPEELKSHVLEPIDELGLPELIDAMKAWEEKDLQPGSIFSFESGGETWWGGVRIFPLGERRLRIAVLAPESDFLAGIVEQRNVVIGITGAALLTAFLVSIALARGYSRPLAALAGQAERIEQLLVEPGDPVRSRLREVDRLAGSHERMRKALDSFARYVPIDVVRELIKRDEAASIGGSRRIITVLFTDIQGFTTIAEALEPEALTRHMADYFEAMLGIVQSDGFGEVTQLTGDGFVAFWGAPIESPDHAAQAVEAVLRCRERLTELNRQWRARGRPELPTRFGLATGPVVVGNVGSPARLVYTAVGDTINLASRLEGINRFYGTWTMVSEDTRKAAGDAFAWRLVDRVRAKGKLQPIDLYELVGRAGEVDPATVAFASAYEEAFTLYRQARFADAARALEPLYSEFPNDRSVSRLLTLARDFQAQPPSEDWDGATVYHEK